MNVSVSPDLEAFVKEQMETGKYNSPDEVVMEALLFMKDGPTEQGWRLEELRREIAVGIEQADRGESAPLDGEEIKAEGRRRLAERQDISGEEAKARNHSQ